MRNSPVAEALWRRLDRDFAEQLAGTTPPKAPEPLPHHDELPRPWPAREGAEL